MARLQKDEKLVLERHSKSILPIIFYVLGAAATFFGFILMVEEENPGILVVGVLLLLVGFVVSKNTDMHLTVTDKRVIMEGPFSKYTVLPLQHITTISAQQAVLHIGSAGGNIQMGGIAYATEVCDTIFALQSADYYGAVAAGDAPDEGVDLTSVSPFGISADPDEDGAEDDEWLCPSCEGDLLYVKERGVWYCPDCNKYYEVVGDGWNKRLKEK